MFVNNLLDKTEEFMIFFKGNDKYILLDKVVFEIAKNDVTWLFKVYLDRINIIKNNNITDYMKNKYEDIDLICLEGNLFVNEKFIRCMLFELVENNILEFEDDIYKIK